MKQVTIPKRSWDGIVRPPRSRTIKVGMTSPEVREIVRHIDGCKDDGYSSIFAHYYDGYYHVSNYSCCSEEYEFNRTTCVCIKVENGVVTAVGRHKPYCGKHCDK